MILVIILTYYLQKNRLKFYKLKTTLQHSEVKDVIQEVAENLSWMSIFDGKQAYVATTNPGILSVSQGEMITIIFDDDNLLINSICNPDGMSSLVSFGRNKMHLRAFVFEIKIAEARKLH